MWEAIDKETVPPAALALQKQQQGGLLVVSGGCSLLNKAADWARSLQLQTGLIPMPLFLPCHGAATLTLISTGLQLTQAERVVVDFFQPITVELAQSI